MSNCSLRLLPRLFTLILGMMLGPKLSVSYAQQPQLGWSDHRFFQWGMRGIAVGPHGSYCMVGTARDTLRLGPNVTVALGQGGTLLAGFDSAGVGQWAVTFEHYPVFPQTRNINRTYPYAVAADRNGNYYVTGTFEGTVTLGGYTIQSSAYFDVMLLKIDSTGHVAWLRRAAGSHVDDQIPSLMEPIDVGSNIVVDTVGNCYVAGAIYPVGATFDSIPGQPPVPFTGGYSFLASWDRHGVLRWKRSGYGSVWGLAGTPSGELYYTARTYRSTLPGGNQDGVSLCKVSNQGQLQWTRTVEIGPRIHTNRSSELNTLGGLSLSASGLLSFAGRYRGNQLLFDGGATVLADSGMYVTQYDTTGQFRWAASVRSVPGPNQQATDVTPVGTMTTNDGRVLVGGSYSGRAWFGAYSLPDGGGGFWTPNTMGFLALYDGQGAVRALSRVVDTLHQANCTVSGVLALSDSTALVRGASQGQAWFGTTPPLPTTGGYLAHVSLPRVVMGLTNDDRQQAPFTLYPNPAHTTVHLTVAATTAAAQPLTVSDALGRVVRRQTLAAGQTEAEVDVRGLPAGLYSVRCGGVGRRLVVE